jgi:two-component system phosphate regulon sensor histidine kinase PhoR
VKYSGRSREIRLEVRRRGKEAEIRVTDYGIGIPRSEQQRIFDSFYRAPEAAKETTGAGLGLALVRNFAQAHGGRVTVESEPGKGSAFSLWLPLVINHGEDSHR